jgi:transcriptional regulator with XRE-family HTH domain
MHDFQTLIRALIDRRFDSDAELASTLGISKPHVSNIVAGKKPLSLKQIDAWADALGLKGQDRADFRFAVEVANSPASIARKLKEVEVELVQIRREAARDREKMARVLAGLRALPGKHQPSR